MVKLVQFQAFLARKENDQNLRVRDDYPQPTPKISCYFIPNGKKVLLVQSLIQHLGLCCFYFIVLSASFETMFFSLLSKIQW